MRATPKPFHRAVGMNPLRLLVEVLALALLVACSVSEDTKQAEQAVQHFHELLDAGDSLAIYESAAEDLKKASSQQDFVAFLDAVHRKLGPSKSSTRKGWNVNYGPTGKFITLNYETTYAEGPAAEQFVYRIAGKDVSLAGYHINSTTLILK
jgi:predicted lipoprotein